MENKASQYGQRVFLSKTKTQVSFLMTSGSLVYGVLIRKISFTFFTFISLRFMCLTLYFYYSFSVL